MLRLVAHRMTGLGGYNKSMNITSDASVVIDAPAREVWHAITDANTVKQWFFGTTVESTWQKDSPIIFRGEWSGQSYEDKGIIRQIKPNKVLEYTHLSSRTGQADMAENYEIVRFELTEANGQTTMRIHEENLATVEARDKSIELWKIVLGNLKKVVES